MRFFSFLALGLLFMLIALPVSAATISLTPATLSVTAGQTFTVSVDVLTGTTKAYTVKSEVMYPASLLEVTGFSFGSGWMPLSQAGYDLTDNSAGRLIKTGGYPGGFSDTKALGTITFKAKADGSATISVGSATAVYDAQSKNTATGAQGSSSVTIGSAQTAQAPATAPETQTTAPANQQKPVAAVVKGQVAGEETSSIESATSTETEPVIDTTKQTAAAAGSETSIPGWLIGLIVVLIVGMGGGWYWYSASKKA